MLGISLGIWQFPTSEDSMALLSQSGVAGTSLTGTLTETTLDTITIPAGCLLANGRLNFWFGGTNSGALGTKTWRLKIGGTTLFTVTNLAAGGAIFDTVGVLWNVNSQSSQRARAFAIRGADALLQAYAGSTAAIDTSVATTLTLTGQLGNVGDSMTRTGFYVDVTPLA